MSACTTANRVVNNAAVAPGKINIAITKIAPTASNALTTTNDNPAINP